MKISTVATILGSVHQHQQPITCLMKQYYRNNTNYPHNSHACYNRAQSPQTLHMPPRREITNSIPSTEFEHNRQIIISNPLISTTHQHTQLIEFHRYLDLRNARNHVINAKFESEFELRMIASNDHQNSNVGRHSTSSNTIIR